MLLDDVTVGVVDVETTGTDPVIDQIVEVGLVSWRHAENATRSIPEASRLCNPGIKIPPGASAIHHLIDEDVASAAPYNPAEFDLFDVYAAHNAGFDKQFLKIDKPFICTMRLAKRLWPDLEGFSNQFLRYRFRLNMENRHESAHRASADALTTAAILKLEMDTLFERHPFRLTECASMADFVAWNDSPMVLHKVDFGKHEGALWSEVDYGYLKWVKGNFEDTPENADILHTVSYYLKAKQASYGGGRR